MYAQYKLRSILKTPERNITGILIPNDVAQFFSGCYFKIEVKKIEGRYGIFCESGAVVIPDKKRLAETKWEDIE